VSGSIYFSDLSCLICLKDRGRTESTIYESTMILPTWLRVFAIERTGIVISQSGGNKEGTENREGVKPARTRNDARYSSCQPDYPPP